MTETSPFFSIWTQSSPYWLFVEGSAGRRLEGFSAVEGHHSLYARKIESDWPEVWGQTAISLSTIQPDGVGIRCGVLPSAVLPPLSEITRSLRTVKELNAVAENLWLLKEIQNNRLGCYMQRVVDRRGKQVGFEAFARMELSDGGVIGGGAIMQAAKALHSEYQIDRLLHRYAVESFVARDLEGYLFINFLTGFIQRPEIYLEGLSQAAERGHMRPGAVVLDVPVTDYTRDLSKLKSIADYCSARGFAIALDDVLSPDVLSTMLNHVRPAFVKLDHKFGHMGNEAKRAAALREIVRISHDIGACVLAEGVENQEMHTIFFEAGVDMFQGYLIGAPERHGAAEAARA